MIAFRRTVSVLALGLLAACVRPKLLDFTFSPEGGSKTYRSTTIEKALQAEFRDQSQPSVVLMTAPSGNDPELRKQLDILKQVPAEELETLFVVACEQDCPTDAYQASPEAIESLVGRSFRVFVLDGAGRVLKDSAAPLTAGELRAIVEQRWIDAMP
ncbi:MAG: hypothetical protein ACREQJ_12880 [Candidatus Binatia bacterium]